MLDIHQKFVLAELHTAEGAAFDSLANQNDDKCHPNTRVALLEEIYRWADNPDGDCIFWLQGMAGTGNGALHPIQEAFWEHHGLQCGYCTPGMIMAAADLLQRNPDPTEDEVRHGFEGNLCRCTGYHNIVKAVLDAAQQGVPA